MTQNVLDYSENPSGIELMDKFLAGMADNQLTNHSGVSRPSYAQAGTFWIDTSATPWVLKQFTGSGDVILGTLDQTGLVFTARRALQDGSGNTITSTYLKTTGTAARATADASGNIITSTYLKKTDITSLKTEFVGLTGNQDISGIKNFLDMPKINGQDVVRQNGANIRLKSTDASSSVAPTSAKSNGLQFYGNDGEATGVVVQEFVANNGQQAMRMGTRRKVNGTWKYSFLKAILNADGTALSHAPTPVSATANDTQIATTTWVNNACKNGYLMGAPNYAASVTVSNTGTYTAPSNGYLFMTITGGGSETVVEINGVMVAYGWWTNTGVGYRASIPMFKNNIINWDTGRITGTINFVPSK